MTARVLAAREQMVHGVACAPGLVFVTEPLAARVVVLSAATGEEVAQVPPPPGGFVLPFSLRVADGTLWVLDPGGFPGAPGVARVHAYDLDGLVHRLGVRLEGLPIGFPEDLEVLPDGSVVVSEAALGALWIVGRDGRVRPGIPPATVARLRPGRLDPLEVDGRPFAARDGFAPGIGSLAVFRGWLYFGTSASGGVHRVPLRALDGRCGDEEVETVTPGRRPEVLKGLVFDEDGALYATDCFRLSVVRIDRETGAREVIATDPERLAFPVAAAILPGTRTLVVTADQEHRLAALNVALGRDELRPPFTVTTIELPPR